MYRSDMPTTGPLHIIVAMASSGNAEGVSPHLFHEDRAQECSTLSLHAFHDLYHVSPVMFLFLLKQCYVCGTLKASTKFRALQQQVHLALQNSPQPGPATFVVSCLYLLPIFDTYSDGFSHLILSSLRRLLKSGPQLPDLLEAKELGAKLFLDIVRGLLDHDERILIKILEALDVNLENVEKAMFGLMGEDCDPSKAKAFVENYILKLIGLQSYMTAVSLLQQFSIHETGESFLYKMIENKDLRAAEKWATFMGKHMLCLLVQEYVKMNMIRGAFGIIKRNNLQKEFPDVCHKYKESSLKKLAEKGCWDIAEERTKGDRQLLEYLVYLAMEAGFSEKVDELCERHSLDGFVKAKGREIMPLQNQYLDLRALLVDDIIWVDEVEGLKYATSYIEECKVVGIDCEWKPNYVKGSKPNKVSIMQLASEKKAFIFDMIKLHNDIPEILDNCLLRVLHSSRILKLGYNFQCDMSQLAQSYKGLECFKQYEMLLDIQKVFKEPCGGLSGLAKKILGAGLNKTRRNTNWEQRPLSRNQLEYAALDAVVLIHIFSHVSGHAQPVDGRDSFCKVEWKSYIIPHKDGMEKPKKGCGPCGGGLKSSKKHQS